MDPSKHQISNSLVKSLGWIALAMYLLIANVVVPSFKSQSGHIEGTLVERITRLETIVLRLENVPVLLATQTEAIANLKVAVEKQGEKIDRHIGK